MTAESGEAAVELLVRFFREEGFATRPLRIAENLDRMLADHSCWCALAVEGGSAQAVVIVSTLLYLERGRLGEIGVRLVSITQGLGDAPMSSMIRQIMALFGG